MGNDVKKVNVQLAKVLKRLNFGQFLFLYLVARNADFKFGRMLLQKLVLRGAPSWSKSKAMKKKDELRESKQVMDQGTPPHSSRNSTVNAPSENSSRPPWLVIMERKAEKDSLFPVPEENQ